MGSETEDRTLPVPPGGWMILRLEQNRGGSWYCKLGESEDQRNAVTKEYGYGRTPGEAVRVAMDTISAKVTESCLWTEDRLGECWNASCSHDFVLIDGSPSNNRMKFCCYCARPIEEQPHDESAPMADQHKTRDA